MQAINEMLAWGLYPAHISDIVPCDNSRLIKDKKGEETIYYTLIIDGEREYARWFDCRRWEGDSWWTGKGTRSYDKKWVAGIKKAEAEADAQDAIKAQEIAEQCAAKFAGLAACVSHPYLTKKGVSAVPNLRVEGNDLVVPGVRLDGKIRTLQTITPDGDKRFVMGRGTKRGAFFPIGLSKSKPTERIVICEGVATGISIFEALNSPVIAAFDRGNLLAVGKAVREQWPDVMIIFAADNDERGDGTISNEGNPGVWSAQQAAVKVGGKTLVVWPNVAGQDWNDVAQVDKSLEILVKASKSEPGESVLTPHSKSPGSDALIVYDGYEASGYDSVYHDEVLDKKEVEVRADGNPKWFNQFIFDSKEPKTRLASMISIREYHSGKSLSNTITFIKNYFKGLFVLNEFSDEIIIRTCPPWIKDGSFRVHRLTDNAVTMMTATLENYGFAPSVERTRAAIEAVAVIDKIHPVRTYFNDLKWDGVPRLGTWLEYYCGATTQPHEYLERIGKMWLTAAVKRIYEPGAVFHNMLVLEGKTNIGKSRTLRELATFGRDIEEEYFTDGIRFKHIHQPAALQILQGKLIVEFAELADMDSESDESLKAWITQNNDEMIKKWEKYATKYPRQFVLAGTTNNDNWLRDPTGNRRFWPVRCTAFKSDEIKRDKEQLWAEAVHLYREGYSVTMPDDDPTYRLAKAEQALRLMDDPWGDILDKETRGRHYLTYQDLYDFLCIPIKDRDNDTDRRIRGAMQAIGWEFRVDFKTSKVKNKVWMRRE